MSNQQDEIEVEWGQFPQRSGWDFDTPVFLTADENDDEIVLILRERVLNFYGGKNPSYQERPHRWGVYAQLLPDDTVRYGLCVRWYEPSQCVLDDDDSIANRSGDVDALRSMLAAERMEEHECAIEEGRDRKEHGN